MWEQTQPSEKYCTTKAPFNLAILIIFCLFENFVRNKIPKIFLLELKLKNPIFRFRNHSRFEQKKITELIILKTWLTYETLKRVHFICIYNNWGLYRSDKRWNVNIVFAKIVKITFFELRILFKSKHSSSLEHFSEGRSQNWKIGHPPYFRFIGWHGVYWFFNVQEWTTYPPIFRSMKNDPRWWVQILDYMIQYVGSYGLYNSYDRFMITWLSIA